MSPGHQSDVGRNQAVLDFTKQFPRTVMRKLIPYKTDLSYPNGMTLDEKIRYGMMAISGASLVFATLGLKVGPLEIIGGFGGS
jgi:hypothetical protein